MSSDKSALSYRVRHLGSFLIAYSVLTYTYSHLGSGNSVRLLEEAQKEGLPITAETCHHYLNLSANEIPDAAAEFKCCPPVRDAWHQEKLWQAIRKVQILN